MPEETKETIFFDEKGKRTTAENAVRAEIIYRTPSGTVTKKEYYHVEDKKSSDSKA